MKTFSRHVVKFGGFFCAVPVMAVYFGFKGLSAKNGPSGHPPGEMPLNRKIAKNYFFWQKIEKIMKKSLEIKNNCLPLYRVKETTRRPGPVPGTKKQQLWQRSNTPPAKSTAITKSRFPAFSMARRLTRLLVLLDLSGWSTILI